jgi:hypothetical protein
MGNSLTDPHRRKTIFYRYNLHCLGRHEEHAIRPRLFNEKIWLKLVKAQLFRPNIAMSLAIIFITLSQ